MRTMMIVSMPHEPFNTAVKDGTVARKMGSILQEAKPEAAYFTEINGRRTGVLIVDLASPSQVPALAEPWFLTFQADVTFHTAMTPEDLQQAGLEKLGKKWG